MFMENKPGETKYRANAFQHIENLNSLLWTETSIHLSSVGGFSGRLSEEAGAGLADKRLLLLISVSPGSRIW